MYLQMGLTIVVALSTVANIIFIIILIKVYKNAKVVESPDNIVKNINILFKELKKFQNAFLLTSSENNKSLTVNLDSLNNAFKENSHLNIKSLKELQENLIKTLEFHLSDIRDSTENTKNQLTSLREYASTQANEVSRYREGYDLTIIKKFAIPVISVIDKLEQSLSENGDHDPFIDEITERLLMVLEAHDIEKFEVSINMDRKFIDNLDSFSQLQANKVADKELDGTVHSVVLQPYVYVHNGEWRAIRNGIISINKYLEE